jgi:hypothetical protein
LGAPRAPRGVLTRVYPREPAGYERISSDVISLFTHFVFRRSLSILHAFPLVSVSRRRPFQMTSRVASLSTGAPFRMPVKEEAARFAYFPPGIPGSLKYAACPAPTARPRFP